MQTEISHLSIESIDLNFLSKSWYNYLKIILHGNHRAAFLTNRSCDLKDYQEIIKKLNVKNEYQCESKRKYANVLIKKELLCPCGQKVFKSKKKCFNTLLKCSSVVRNFSEKTFKDFDLMILPQEAIFTSQLNEEKRLLNLKSILLKAYEIKQRRGQERPNSDLMIYELKKHINPEIIDFQLLPDNIEYTSLKSLLSVARTLADLEESDLIELKHIEEAKGLTVLKLQTLKSSF